jgi:hypothetical protein
MRKLLTLSAVVAMVLAIGVAGPVSAGSRTAVTMTVTTTFDEFADAFTATGIPDCGWGSVYDVGAHLAFTPVHGVFAGYKLFDCEDSGVNGFVVRLNARFDESGSVGTWAVLDSWGALAAMTGAGKQTGDPIENGIIDRYVGSMVL